MNKLIFKVFYSTTDLLLLLSVTILLTSCIGFTGNITYQIPHDVGEEPQVIFCPKQDCSKVFVDNILSANDSVYCAFYSLDLVKITEALIHKSKEIDVKIVIDNSNYKGQIKGSGVKFDDRAQLMHNKFCVFDDEIVITGSFNPTRRDNDFNNNNIVVVHSKMLAGNYKDEFTELWSGEFGSGSTVKYPILRLNDLMIENYFCPDDECSSRIIELIKNSKKNVYFMTFSFTNEDIADALIKKDGIEIKGLFDTGQASSKYSQFKRLQEFGVNVKKDTNKHKLHHKVFVVDNQTVVTGSFNPTLSADTKNDENILIIHDEKIAKRFLDEFESIWI